MQFLGACGVRTILLSSGPTTTFSYYSSHQHGAHAFTVELGKVRPFGENDMTRFIEARQALQELVTRDEVVLEPWRADDFTIFAIDRVINKQTAAFRFPVCQRRGQFHRISRGLCWRKTGIGNTG